MPGSGTQELLLIEQRVTNEGRSVGVAYLLWLFLGFLSGHRFYLRRPGTAILEIPQLYCDRACLGPDRCVPDPGMVRDEHAKLRDDLIRQATVGLVSRS